MTAKPAAASLGFAILVLFVCPGVATAEEPPLRFEPLAMEMRRLDLGSLPSLIFADGFEDGTTGGWSQSENGLPSITASADPLSGVSPLDVQFSAMVAGGEPPFAFVWDFGDGQGSVETNPQHTYTTTQLPNEQFTATVTVTDADGAMDTSAGLIITVTPPNQPPTVDAGGGIDGLQCTFPGGAVVLSAVGDDPDGDNLNLMYSWVFTSIPDGAPDPMFSNPNLRNPVFTTTAAGEYVLVVTVSDGELTDVDNVVVDASDRPGVISVVGSTDRSGRELTSIASMTVNVVNDCTLVDAEAVMNFPVPGATVSWSAEDASLGTMMTTTDMNGDTTNSTGTFGSTEDDPSGIGSITVSASNPIQADPTATFDLSFTGCDDSLVNDNETDVDCGGNHPARQCRRCGFEELCAINGDCDFVGPPALACRSNVCSLPGIWFVDANAFGLDDGSSWSNAFGDLQDALAVISPGDEVWVADTAQYLPTSTADRDAAFIMDQPNVVVRGGFDATEDEVSDRPPGARTTLSGDIDGDDLDCEALGLAFFPADGNNSRTVVSIENATGVLLDSFIIEGGNANAAGGNDSGGGVNVIASRNVTLHDLTVQCNRATDDGGGIWLDSLSGSSDGLLITDSTIRYNVATQMGGGLYLDGGGFITDSVNVVDSSFVDNEATGSFGRGGAIAVLSLGDTLSVLGTTFAGNRANWRGGGMYVDASDVAIDESTPGTRSGFDGNWAGPDPGGLPSTQSDLSGGALFALDSGSLTVAHTDFEGNVAWEHGGGLYLDNVSALLEEVTFSNNNAGTDARSGTPSGESGNGGGMHVLGGDVAAVDVDFFGNVAQDSGGGVLLASSASAAYDRSELASNVAVSGNGGALALFDGAVAQADNSLFVGNSAGLAGGAAYNAESTLNVFHGTFFGNSSPGLGQHVADLPAAGGSLTTIGNTILYEAAVNDAVSLDASGTVQFSDICDAQWMIPGNVCLDPLYVSPPVSLELIAGSPLLDTGSDLYCDQPLTGLDLSQSPRAVDHPLVGNDGADTCDLGAYEVQLP